MSGRGSWTINQEVSEGQYKRFLIDVLRKESGFGVMICKRCLEDYNWDFDRARKEIRLHNKYTHTRLYEKFI